MNQQASQWLTRQKDIAPLVTFRILFGLLMAVGMLRFWMLGWVDKLFTEPSFFFKFYGFEWVVVPSPLLVYALHSLAILSALFIAFGLFYRMSAILFFLTFCYIEMMDATNYLNHYYLVAILTFLLIFLPANRMHSLDVKFRWVKPANKVPAIAINILIIQILLVYTFAGIAKLNYDWLVRAMPLRVWLPEHADLPLIGTLLSIPETAWVFSWFGAFYDLTIGFWMLFSRTRKWAYVFVIVFHLLTNLFFNIGLFPVIMICSTTIFFSSDTHRKWQSFFGLKYTESNHNPGYGHWLTPVVVLYLLFQVTFPLRHYLYPGNVLITEEGYRFSWRVMLVEKAGSATFKIVDKQSGRSSEIVNSQYLTSFQEKQMAIQPDLMLQFARFIAGQYRNELKEPAVYVNSYITLNGRVSARFIDPDLDLLTVKDSFRPRSWVKVKYFSDLE